MDNIKIEIIGRGVEIIGGLLTNKQLGYIISHQSECNTTIPLFNDDFTITYKNWKDINDLCNTFGSTYEAGSEIILTVNNVITELTTFTEDRNFINVDNVNPYIVSMQHVYGKVLSFNFTVENFDKNKLTFLIDDLNSISWGEIICGVKYDGVLQNNLLTETTDVEFESLLFKNNNIMPIQNKSIIF